MKIRTKNNKLCFELIAKARGIEDNQSLSGLSFKNEYRLNSKKKINKLSAIALRVCNRSKEFREKNKTDATDGIIRLSNISLAIINNNIAEKGKKIDTATLEIKSKFWSGNDS
jgi:hypothetical protein